MEIPLRSRQKMLDQESSDQDPIKAILENSNNSQDDIEETLISKVRQYQLLREEEEKQELNHNF